jgi:acyl-CoA dehydrogenase
LVADEESSMSAFTSWRARHITRPILNGYRKVLPPISETERDAIAAGTVWWDAELFSGKPDWTKLRSFPKPALSAEEQAFLDGPVEKLCSMLSDWEIRRAGDLPQEVWSFIRDNGFMGMIIPKERGGLGFSALAHSAVVVKIASRSPTAAVTVMVPNSLGPAELLLRYGTDAQRDYYLPRLAKGQEIPCFALTAPEAGSDAAAMPDKGVVCRGEWKGKQVLGIRVTWNKRYITLAPVATILGLAFRLHDPDHLLGDKDDIGITLALIPTDTPGVEIGRRHFPAGQSFQNGPTRGENVFIPMDFIIGGRDRVGQGWRMLMDCLAAGRAISLPGLGTAASMFCARMTGAYARVRRQFGVAIGRFEGIEAPLARIAGFAYSLDAARRITAAALDAGQQPSVISAMLKYHATERMRIAVDDAMDIHGGRAIQDGPRNYLFGTYQSVPVAITVEGANILTRSLMIFGQGAIR